MRITRAIAAAAALLATLAVPTPARADLVPPVPFSADSGDACGYGYTKGSLLWVTPGPLPPIAVTVAGVVGDRPVTAETFGCRDDGFYSTVSFTAYSGSVVVGSQAARANNGEERFEFSLGPGTADTTVTHLVVQVCRHPLVTMPPSYCGLAVTYRSTSVAPTS